MDAHKIVLHEVQSHRVDVLLNLLTARRSSADTLVARLALSAAFAIVALLLVGML
jgi:hypothetical protein